MNLDPGAEHIPYTSDFGIDHFFTTRKIMIEEKLVPNAVMIEASNRIVRERKLVIDKIFSLNAETTIIDTG